MTEAVVGDFDKLWIPGRAGYDVSGRAGYDVSGRAGYDIANRAGYDIRGDPDLMKSSPT